MGHPKFSEEDFLAAALVAERGVAGLTVVAGSERVGAPTGSFYPPLRLARCSIGIVVASRIGNRLLYTNATILSTGPLRSIFKRVAQGWGQSRCEKQAVRKILGLRPN
jgi:hypothetical protein